MGTKNNGYRKESKMKSKRKSYHVIYSKKLKVWRVKLNGKAIPDAQRPIKHTRGNTDFGAVDIAIYLARRNQPSQVIIHKMDGKIQKERTYPRSSDPRRTKG